MATKYQVAAVVKGEKASNFVKALERGWFRHFDTPKELILMKVADGYMKTSPTFWPSSTFSTLLPLARHIPEWVPASR